MSERASATDQALAAERAEYEATAVAFANSERHVSELLSACVIKDDTINKQAVELDEANARIATLLQRIAELEAQVTPVKFGVCSHQLTFRDTIYAQDANVEAAVDDLGATFVRDMLPATGEPAWQIAKAAIIRHFNKGRKHHLTVGKYADINTYDWAKARTRLVSVAGTLEGVAGVNEPDGDGRPRSTWLPQVVKHQAKLYDTVQTDPQLVGTRVALGALRWANQNWAADNAAMVAACKGKFDEFNLHFYPGPGSDVLAEMRAAVQQIRQWTDKPIIITEAGGTTANMSLDEQARICRDLVLAGAELGVKVCIYELMDDPDAGGKAVQANFGAYESDFTRKPAADALSALVK